MVTGLGLGLSGNHDGKSDAKHAERQPEALRWPRQRSDSLEAKGRRRASLFIPGESPTTPAVRKYTANSDELSRTTGRIRQSVSQVDFETKFKTELCKHWEVSGNCPWGDECSFAHGQMEIRSKQTISSKYKTKKCRQFHTYGFCPYGKRCQFLHHVCDETKLHFTLLLVTRTNREMKGVNSPSGGLPFFEELRCKCYPSPLWSPALTETPDGTVEEIFEWDIDRDN